MAKFFALSFLLQSCLVVQAQQYGNNVPAIQKQMLAAMDTCIEYMTAALICHPPKRKLEKVCSRATRTLDRPVTWRWNKCNFSITIDLEVFSLMQFTIKQLENVKIVVDDNLQLVIVVTWLISILNLMLWTTSVILSLLSIRKLRTLTTATLLILMTTSMLDPMKGKLKKEKSREEKFLLLNKGVKNSLWIH